MVPPPRKGSDSGGAVCPTLRPTPATDGDAVTGDDAGDDGAADGEENAPWEAGAVVWRGDTDGAVLGDTDGAVLGDADGAVLGDTDDAALGDTDGAVLGDTDGAVLASGTTIGNATNAAAATRTTTTRPATIPTTVGERIGRSVRCGRGGDRRRPPLRSADP